VDRLTDKQREALQYAAQGLTDQQIAAALGISRESVNDRMRTAMLNLGAQTRAQAVAAALTAKLITYRAAT
jgi:LuxR family quorum sensing-dependent transcriptional regulator